jgi:hypothetical protein
MLGCGGCKFAKLMNEWGPERCLAEIDTLVGMLQASRKSMGDSACRRMIAMAVERSAVPVA